ncbi:MAG: transcriptional regulator [Chloroflexi bacterium 13_1_40CM_67_9]|nr:MAG: transcriptional regulator [Chloroflexi bacterium 13_1_40CM_67_9]
MQEILSALAEPNRLQIVELLRRKPHAVGEIVERLRLRQPQVSKHLRVLSEAGLVEVQPVGQQRIYRLRAQALKDLDTWLEPYRRAWDERFDQLDDVLSDLKRKEKGKRDDNNE